MRNSLITHHDGFGRFLARHRYGCDSLPLERSCYLNHN